MTYVKLFRVKHYIKNVLIFFPLIFSLNLFEVSLFVDTLLGFMSFSLLASVVYMLNDIQDVEEDRRHPTKKNRPIASGAVAVGTARYLALLLLALSLGLMSWLGSFRVLGWLLLYLLNNLLYTYKLKTLPILDVFSIAVGFLLRIVFGAAIIGVSVSPFLYLTVLALAFYMGYGKRRGEYHHKYQREVLSGYDFNFLEKSMTSCQVLAVVFYVMWSLQLRDDYAILMITAPLVLLILMRYSLMIETVTDGDPVEVIFKDKILLTSATLYGSVLLLLLYW